ncbi:MAG: serine O-acetyltransferase [Thermoguttaceae bacterium]
MTLNIRPKGIVHEMTERIVQSYTDEGSIQHLDHCPLPNYETVQSILDDLRELLFPGYRRRSRLHVNNVLYHVGDIVDRLLERLTLQISRAWCHSQGQNFVCSPEKRFENEQWGEEKAVSFLNQIPEIRRILATDVNAAFAGDPACKSKDEVIFCYPGLEAITIYRLAHTLHVLGVPLIPRMMTEQAHRVTGIDIHPGATIGEHFFIDHGTGVVIGETCIIGNWVKLYQGVTLGALSFPKDETGQLIRTTKRHPTIEDNVVIYANATVLGGDTVVGHDSVIGSSVWLTHSVAPGTVVMIEKPNLKIRQH